MKDQAGPTAAARERDLEEVRVEQDLLWSVIELVRRGRGRPAQGRLDALLAGLPYGPIGLVVARPRSGADRTPRTDAFVPLT